MLSGEIDIDPYTLDSVPKQILFLVFVFTSFILFNLINGLAINDIQQLRNHAEFLSLKQLITNASESEGVLYNFYWKIRQNYEHSWWRQSLIYFMSLLVRKYPHLHKMDNLCINFKTKVVKYEADEKRYHILQTRDGNVNKYTLNVETLKKLRAILDNRLTQVENVNEKVEHLQSELKMLKMSMRNQHEEMKKLILECVSAKS
jgi:DNA repair ATPase RecN